jgi:hypothetical protein
MLATRVAEWKQPFLQEGRLKGEAKVSLRQLERLFGPVPDPVRDRIARANVAGPNQRTMRVLDAGSIDDVLS